MKDILIQHRDRYVECEIDGLELIYTYSDEPNRHYILTLRDENSYVGLKNKIREIYESYYNKNEGYEVACKLCLETPKRDEFFTDDIGVTYCDIRSREEMEAYEKEAFDKVWLMRTQPVDIAEIEHSRQKAVQRILSTYSDIPEDGYSDWECGYWNGILGALRWAMGDEKNFIDT